MNLTHTNSTPHGYHRPCGPKISSMMEGSSRTSTGTTRQTSPSPSRPARASQSPVPTTQTIRLEVLLKTHTGHSAKDAYMVHLDDGTMLCAPSSHLTAVDPTPTVPLHSSASPTLPHWLAHGSKVTFAKDGTFHKGFLLHQPHDSYRFSVRHRLSSKREEWGVDLPSFSSEWPTLCLEDRLHPSWIIPSTIAPPAPPASASTTNFDPASLPPLRGIPACMPRTLGCIGSACHVSAKSLQNPCPPSLQKALDPSNVDRAVWLES